MQPGRLQSRRAPCLAERVPGMVWLRKAPGSRWIGGLFLLASSAVSAISGGGGTVVDSTTGAAIANATVSVECMISKPFHGSYRVTTLSTTTDAQGQFSFSTPSVFLCEFVYVKPSKEGYFATGTKDVRYRGSISEIRPKQFLTPVGQERLQEIKGLVAQSNIGASGHVSNYSSLYNLFGRSWQIAKSADEFQLIKDSYCSRLMDIYGALSVADRAALGKYGDSVRNVPIDHDKHVKPHCTK